MLSPGVHPRELGWAAFYALDHAELGRTRNGEHWLRIHTGKCGTVEWLRLSDREARDFILGNSMAAHLSSNALDDLPVVPGIEPTIYKHPRPDGQPGLEWELHPGMDLDPVMEAEGLTALTFKDPTDERMGDLAERSDGTLVFLDEVQPGPIRMREVSPLEALSWYVHRCLPLSLSRAFNELRNEVQKLREQASHDEAA